MGRCGRIEYYETDSNSGALYTLLEPLVRQENDNRAKDLLSILA
jgi:hypothetical protein